MKNHSEYWRLNETIARGFKEVANVLEAHFKNQDRDFQERVLLAIKENKKKSK